MAIDIRATVACSLGELISASIGDTGIAGVGVIKTTGSCVVKGIIAPAPSTSVTFTYTKNGQTYSIPRSLLVLSSYADPFRRVTQVNLGCVLKYKENQQEYETLEALNDPANSAYTQDDTEIITVPVTANTIFLTCLDRLGVSYPNSGPTSWITNPVLTNTFNIKQFDFRQSYVSIMDGLLVSESKCGYVLNNTFQLFSLNEDPGTAPVLDLSNIIDIAPNGNATPPADVVLVNYSSLKLRPPDPSNSGGSLQLEEVGDFKVYYDDQWEKNISESPVIDYPIAYQTISADGVVTNNTKVYSGRSVTTSTTRYKNKKVINGRDERGRPVYENIEVVASRESITEEPYAKIAGKYLSAVLSVGGTEASGLTSIGSATITTEQSIETFEYDENGNEIVSTVSRYVPRSAIGYGQDLPVYVRNSPSQLDFLDLSNTLVEVERTIKTTKKQATRSRVVTTSYGLWADTPSGMQALAEAKDKLMTIYDIKALIDSLEGLVYLGESITTSLISPSRALAQSRPSRSEIINQRYSDGGSAANDWKAQEETEYSIAINGSTSGIRTLLSLPYAPDDRFIKSGSSYTSVRSDAPLKALTYARVQNSMATGSAYGVLLQTKPELLPARPFKEIVIQANGLSALYRTDSISWSMDSNGVIASFAGLFYGAVGGTGDFWFPVADGITTLPETPPIVDGEMTIPAVVPLGNEIIRFQSTVRSGVQVTSYGYDLQLLTVISISTRAGISVQSSGVYRAVNIPISAIGILATAPTIDTPVYILPPAVALQLNGSVPVIRASVGDVYAATATISATAMPPITRAYAGRVQVTVTKQINVIGRVPALRIGASSIEPDNIEITAVVSSPVIGVGRSILIDQLPIVAVSASQVEIKTDTIVLSPVVETAVDAGDTITRIYHELYEDIATDWSYRSFLTSDMVIGYERGSIIIATGTVVLPPAAQIDINITGIFKTLDNYIMYEIFDDAPIVPSFGGYVLKFDGFGGFEIPVPTIIKVLPVEIDITPVISMAGLAPSGVGRVVNIESPKAGVTVSAKVPSITAYGGYYGDIIYQQYHYDLELFTEWWGA